MALEPAVTRLCLVLHAHVPFGAPGSEAERWFAEAAVESHLPVALALEDLVARGVPVRLTVSLSPTVLAATEHRASAVAALVRQKAAALEALSARHPGAAAAQLRQLRSVERAMPGGLLAPWERLAQSGAVELITTAATHGFLPLLQGVSAAVRSQLRTGYAAFERALGARPHGLWLPECAYTPALGDHLEALGARFVFVEGSAVERAGLSTEAGVLLPCGAVALGRDQQTGALVWSAHSGYPGAAAYLEFHHREQSQRVVAISRGPYDEAAALAQAGAHAADFVERLAGRGDATVVAPYDFELFGHWWHEGPAFLAGVLERCAGRVELLTASEAAVSPRQRGELPDSSWGRGGGRAVWLSAENAWVWPHLERAALRLESLASRRPPGPALGEAERRLLLAQASDWPFLLEARTSAGFARAQVEQHLLAFTRAADAAERGEEFTPSPEPFPWLDGSNFQTL